MNNQYNNKKYYWIKLKTNFFNQSAIDFMLSQKNGCEYVVLYQMLCLKTANNNGRLETTIGEVLIPYNFEKIARDTKYFDVDTVAVALELYKKLGLIYEEEDKILKIVNYEQMIGSESKWAESKRLYREKQKKQQQLLTESTEKNEDKVKDNARTLSDKSIEYRDKSIEYRDKSIEYRDIEYRDIEKEKDYLMPLGEFENVLLTQEELEKLKDKILNYSNKIENLSAYLKNNPKKKYASHYATILNWVRREEEKNSNYVKQENPPSWFDKEIEAIPITEQEQKELDNLFKKIR